MQQANLWLYKNSEEHSAIPSPAVTSEAGPSAVTCQAGSSAVTSEAGSPGFIKPDIRHLKINYVRMKASILGIFLLIIGVQWSFAQNSAAEKEIINLSKVKWQWMSEKNVDSLALLFHEKAVFVHMGGAWGTEQELNIIKGGGIWYKKADIQ